MESVSTKVDMRWEGEGLWKMAIKWKGVRKRVRGGKRSWIIKKWRGSMWCKPYFERCNLFFRVANEKLFFLFIIYCRGFTIILNKIMTTSFTQQRSFCNFKPPKFYLGWIFWATTNRVPSDSGWLAFYSWV